MKICSRSPNPKVLGILFALAGILFAQKPGVPSNPLQIIRPTFHQIEDGPAIGSTGYFIPGETVFFRCEVQGYSLTKNREVTLSYRVEALDGDGLPLVPPLERKMDSVLSEEDKNWRPVIRHSFQMPPFAMTGNYLVRVALKDERAGAETKVEASFPVKGRPLQPVEGLSIQNFGFYRGESDAEPLGVAAYRPGDTMWARFDVTGFKLGPNNAVHISYGIAIADANGRVLFKQAEPTVDQTTSFYPKRYVSCTLNLNIQPNTKPQEFALNITVTDHNGIQTKESSQRFRVE